VVVGWGWRGGVKRRKASTQRGGGARRAAAPHLVDLLLNLCALQAVKLCSVALKLCIELVLCAAGAGHALRAPQCARRQLSRRQPSAAAAAANAAAAAHASGAAAVLALAGHCRVRALAGVVPPPPRVAAHKHHHPPALVARGQVVPRLVKAHRGQHVRLIVVLLRQPVPKTLQCASGRAWCGGLGGSASGPCKGKRAARATLLIRTWPKRTKGAAASSAILEKHYCAAIKDYNMQGCSSGVVG
jgi:hypothetical protein